MSQNDGVTHLVANKVGQKTSSIFGLEVNQLLDYRLLDCGQRRVSRPGNFGGPQALTQASGVIGQALECADPKQRVSRDKQPFECANGVGASRAAEGFGSGALNVGVGVLEGGDQR